VTRFGAAPSIQQTVTCELKKKRLSDVNVVPNRAGTVLSDDVNEYFYLF
jgi:hypothetical protein